MFQGNGGCYIFAKCTMTGPGKRNCTCAVDQIGDGIKCKSKLHQVSTIELSNSSNTLQFMYRLLYCPHPNFIIQFMTMDHYKYTPNTFNISYTHWKGRKCWPNITTDIQQHTNIIISLLDVIIRYLYYGHVYSSVYIV